MNMNFYKDILEMNILFLKGTLAREKSMLEKLQSLDNTPFVSDDEIQKAAKDCLEELMEVMWFRGELPEEGVATEIIARYIRACGGSPE